MSNITYNILWIDDEHESLAGTKGRAKRNGINLVPFKSLNGGMAELERNSAFYDGILLDAKFFENEDDQKGSEDTYNVHRAKERLLQMQKKFEIFVLTGQAEAYKDSTFKKAFTKVYIKGDEGYAQLWNDIKDSASSMVDTRIRHAYNRVFEVCTEKYIGEYAAQDLLNLLKSKESSDLNTQFTAIRKIVEDIFIAFNKYQLLPAEFITPSVSLNETSKFLSGKNHKGELFTEKGYQHLDGTHLPAQISSMLWNILNITQDGSHRSRIDAHVKSLNTPYLGQSVLFQLLDLIIWFKEHVDSNPQTENWTKVDSPKSEEKSQSKKGTVIQLNPIKGFAFCEPQDGSENVFIPSHLVLKNNLKDGDKISIEIEDYIDNRTNENRRRVKKILVRK